MAPVPRRNLELKARDPDPAATLRAALATGATDRGVLHQRDTYFAAAPGRRLKLREQTPGGAQLIAYDRADDASARESRYDLVDVSDPDTLRAALDAALGTTIVVTKQRRLLLKDNVRIHLDEVDGLGSFVELEAVVPPGGQTDLEAARVAALRGDLGIVDDRIVAAGYAQLLDAAPRSRSSVPVGPVDAERAPTESSSPAHDAPVRTGGRGFASDAGSPMAPSSAATASRCIPDRAGDVGALVAVAREAMGRAYAPYSGFAVGVALRDERGAVHAGANVENSSYPQGQCAETSALGALVAAGGTQVREVAVMADTALITPCGGCRQRLSEFAGAETPVHLCGPEGVRRTVTLGDLLPLSFGAEDLPA